MLAIIVPVLNEGADLAQAMQRLAPLRARGAKLVLADGGSTDGCVAAAQEWVDHVVAAPRGRAAQMNAGARACPAQAYVFLHADTQLPPEADLLIDNALNHGRVWGRFDVRLDSPRPLLRVVSWAMNLRSRLTGIATGDQAIFMSRAAFEAVGGFPAQALMEDIAISGQLKALSPPACLPQKVTTSARRWLAGGVLRTIFLMWRLRLAYFWGAPPDELARRYGYAPLVPPAFSIAIMAKAPQPGLAKTRLIPVLGAAGAARLQRRFTLATLAQAQQAEPASTVLWCAPDAQHRFFKALQRRCGVLTQPQPTGDLGQRMHAAAEYAAGPVLIIGTDCPALSAAHLQHAAHALAQHDVVLIPAEDGGYVLIGLRRPAWAVFEGVVWSTPQVLAHTRQRLQAAGLHWAELAPLWDVDTPLDYKRLVESQTP